MVFLDDGLGFGELLQEAKYFSAMVRDDIIKSGFVPNVQKSIWKPSQSMEWIGYDIDLEANLMSVPGRRISSIQQGVSKLLMTNNSSFRMSKVRYLARIAGKIVSNSLVVGNMVRLMTKVIHVCIETRSSWDIFVKLSDNAIMELEFWRDNIHSVKSTYMGPKARE